MNLGFFEGKIWDLGSNLGNFGSNLGGTGGKLGDFGRKLKNFGGNWEKFGKFRGFWAEKFWENLGQIWGNFLGKLG